jgi:arginyl-tRNA synthetase
MTAGRAHKQIRGKKTVIVLPKAHAELVRKALLAAQQAGDLPEFELPEIDIKPPRNAEQGDYASSAAMALARTLGRKPIEIAEAIARHLEQPAYVESIEVAAPGFINFRLNRDWLRAQIETVINEGEQLGRLTLGEGKRAQVEFVSANPTGPLHIGRSRGAVVGDTLARLFEAAGYAVEREYYFNNAGMQMQNLGKSLRIRYLQELGIHTDDELMYKGDYLVEFARELAAEQGNALTEATWQPFKEYAEKKMFEMIRRTLERIDIRHDHFFNENSLYDDDSVWDVLKRLDAAGHIYESAVREGESDEVVAQNRDLSPAKWFRSTQFGDKEDRVVVKSDGAPTYTLPDIAYHLNKLGRGFDVLINILGADHFVEHQVVKYGVQALGGDINRINVVIMQFVRLIRNGKEYKMSTREGNYETLDDLIEQTSADAVRYMLLARNTNSRLDFDLDLAVKQTNENPVYYIQYAYVRCAGIFREAAARGFSDEGADLSLLGDVELNFMRKILALSEEIEYAVVNFAPHNIAFYALDLAQQFQPVYDAVRVFGEGVPEDVARARLRFYRAALTAFNRVLTLMGMSKPERM